MGGSLPFELNPRVGINEDKNWEIVKVLLMTDTKPKTESKKAPFTSHSGQ